MGANNIKCCTNPDFTTSGNFDRDIDEENDL